MVIADSVLGRRAVHTDELLAALGLRERLQIKAHVSQVRPHFHLATADAFSKSPRREHVLVLSPAGQRERRVIRS